MRSAVRLGGEDAKISLEEAGTARLRTAGGKSAQFSIGPSKSRCEGLAKGPVTRAQGGQGLHVYARLGEKARSFGAGLGAVCGAL